ncbi:MAG TPA: SNF2-related protein, partial [Polyangiales bacterium]|nr:SNF2-related protein [Polyangiales bacterium]
EPDEEIAPNRERDGHLSVRLRIEGDKISVGVLLHKPNRSRSSPGKLIAPLRAARTRAADERERPLLEALGASTRTFHPQYLPADLSILRALVEAPRVSLDDDDAPLRLTEQTLHVQLIEQPAGLSPQVTLAGVAIAPREPSPRASYLFHHDRALQTLWFAPLSPPLRRLLRALEHFHGLLPPESHGALASWLPSLRTVAQVSVPASLQHEELTVPRRLLLRITPNIEVGIEVALASRPLPLGALWPPAQGPELVHGLLEGRQVSARRDIAWEREAALSISEKLELARHPPLRPFEHRIDDEQAALELLSRAATLTDALDLEWAETKPRLSIQTSLRASNLSIRMFKRAGHWLSVEGGARNRDAHVALDRLLEAARRGERFVRIAEGSYAEIERELFERLERAQLCVHELTSSTIALSSVGARYWQEALGSETEAANADVRTWLDRAVAYDPKDAPPIAERWRSILRDYQIAGVRFLMHMASWAPGACLADEMGLGKTLQAIALLESRAALGPALVLAPTSVVSNWAAELARFAPELTVTIYRGSERERAFDQLGPNAILLSSYELLQRDEARFEKISFAT